LTTHFWELVDYPSVMRPAYMISRRPKLIIYRTLFGDKESRWSP